MMNHFPLILIISILVSLSHISSQSVSRDLNDVEFYLYPNAKSLNDKDLLVHEDIKSIKSSRYDPGKKLILLIHGFAQNYTLEFPRVVKDAYLAARRTQNANIIAVDWGKLSTPTPAIHPWKKNFFNMEFTTLLNLLEYNSAADNVPIVGQRVADFITFLHQNRQLKNGLSQVHIIGMSLGAHVAGAAGLAIQKSLGEKIARITGLDPAGPGFKKASSFQRLDPTDAEYVDVIHTNQGVFGFSGTLGKADFMVNGGGPFQPGCDMSFNITRLFCSHDKSVYYYANSIKDNTLRACRCYLYPVQLLCTTWCTGFGESSSPSSSGAYHIRLITKEGNRESYDEKVTPAATKE